MGSHWRKPLSPVSQIRLRVTPPTPEHQCKPTQPYTHVYTHKHIRAYTNTYKGRHARTHACANIHTYTYTYIHRLTRTHTRTRTHTSMYSGRVGAHFRVHSCLFGQVSVAWSLHSASLRLPTADARRRPPPGRWERIWTPQRRGQG